MLPARAGEFIVGVLASGLVFNYHYIKISKIICCSANLIGTIIIFTSIILLHENNVFPGFRAIPPTIGTALLILAGHFNTGSLTVKCLSAKVVRFIGKISYSAYLWHWPLLAFYRYVNYEVTIYSGIVLFILTIFISHLSYKYIEQPFRKTDKTFCIILLSYFIIPALVLAVMTIIFIKLDGYGVRTFYGDYEHKYKTLMKKTSAASGGSSVINPEFIDDNNKILLIGDSNAAHYVGLLTEFGKDSKFGFRKISASSCQPILDNTPEGFVRKNLKKKQRINCIKHSRIIRSMVKDYDILILAARWPTEMVNYITGEDYYDNLFNNLIELANLGKTIILMGQAPIIYGYDRNCLAKSISFPWVKCKQKFSIHKHLPKVNSRLSKFAESHEHIKFYAINDYLCSDGFCYSEDEDKQPLFFNKSHLSHEGSHKIGRLIIKKDGVPDIFKNFNIKLINNHLEY